MNYISKLKRLYISEGYIEDKGIMEFSEYLRYITDLEELSMNVNEISDYGMNKMIRELQNCMKLKKMELNDNNIRNLEKISQDIKRAVSNPKMKVIIK